MNPEDVVVGIVALNGGELVGRTRLQKTAYLLDRSGMESGLQFVYHHYGPFSAELADGWKVAALDGRVGMSECPGYRAMPYTHFTTNEMPPDRLGELPVARAESLIAAMGERSDIVLELAATIIFLRDRVRDPVEEVAIRKPHKATAARLAKAQELISALGLSN